MRADTTTTTATLSRTSVGLTLLALGLLFVLALLRN
jgi:hypothetical protein